MTLFAQLHVWISFDEFTMGVLMLLNVATTQLHLNSWSCIQTFMLICELLYLSLSLKCFLYFYYTWSRDLAMWMSLIKKPKALLLGPYLDSFKNFKARFFRVVVNPSG
ncbi:hypothetical protein V8G54_024339 [Vigna mungo]|uniref:Uncharacterized protein n=1 Tax=Vigna mungo TaxID=3915 RepID=A0AAQ3N5D9_VIGMU